MLPVAAEPICDGAVAVLDGRIAMVGAASAVAAAYPSLPVHDLGHAVLAPGFIDVHCHVEWSLTGGLFPSDDGFGPWIGALLGLNERRTREMHAAAAALGALRALQAGSTTLMDAGPTGAGVAALTRTGQRGIVCPEAFGTHPEHAPASAERCAATVAEVAAHAGPRVTVGISPHAPYSTCPALWRALADHLPHGTPWTTHLAESTHELDALRGHGVLTEAMRAHGMGTPVWPLDETGSPITALDRDPGIPAGLVVAHAVHIGDADIEALARSGARVAHCPVSNVTLRCGRSPIERLRAAGVPVALGTDSPASAGAYDLRREARACHTLHAAAGIHIAHRTLVEMITRDAARVLGRDDVGCLQPGAAADLVAVTPAAEWIDGDPHVALLEASSRVTGVWVEGERLLDNGTPTHVDATAIESTAAAARAALC